MIARVFRRLGILPYNTKDELGDKRYSAHSPGYLYRYSQMLCSDCQYYWYQQYSMNMREGLNHSALNCVSFHYIKNDNQM